MKHPRILMVSGEAPPMIGGVGASTEQLLIELRKLRADWKWVWLSRRPRWFSPPWRRRGGVWLVRPTHSWNRRGIALASSLVRAWRPDLIHIQDEPFSFFHSDAPCRLIEAARGARVVTTLHEFHIDRPDSSRTAELVERSDVVIANDRRTADRCLEATGRAVDHLLWSANTIPPPEASARPEPKAGLFTTFGHINGLKAIGLVFEAMAKVRAEHPELRWQIVGPFHPDKNPDHAALAERLRGDWVRFTGGLHGRELQTRLVESHAMLLPFSDGASTRRGSLQVAWAFGLPVVTTPSAIPEPSIVDEENCLLVGEPTADAWAEAIARLLENPELTARLRHGSLATAERFSVASQARKHVEIYESLL